MDQGHVTPRGGPEWAQAWPRSRRRIAVEGDRSTGTDGSDAFGHHTVSGILGLPMPRER
ncbi:hypothetical protein [Streptomyces yaizuensis]|uniref:Uncharacterized protein n=1 Tax=Streptomyces yaizuensis TaxID=2989713 RepID=A0ABQ5P6G1_9ACTN|nr:hypothetical protein [Streptomyces sp. YSPA8]GLF98170.1 hypothetical protein SYYSPA8_27755 [Streptomyces sp. YSPA8]